MNDDVLTLARLNGAPHKDFVALLAGTYEHSPWVSERAWPRGPFRDARAAQANARRGRHRGRARRAARPAALAPRARRQGDGRRDDDGRVEPRAGPGRPHRVHAGRAGEIARLNAAYRDRFGFPFMLAVRGPRGTGLDQGARSSPPSSAGSRTTRTSSSPRRCATSTASPSCASTTASASGRCSASRRGTAPSCWRATPIRATPRTASSPSPTSPTRTAPPPRSSSAGCASAASTASRSTPSATSSASIAPRRRTRRRCSPARTTTP